MLLSLPAECPTVSTESTSATSFGTDAIPSVVTGAVSSVVSEAKQGNNITTIGISYVIVYSCMEHKTGSNLCESPLTKLTNNLT